MSSIAGQVGASRIVIGGQIPHPVGDPTLPADRERAFRRRLVETALKALQTPVDKPTVFAIGME
jgi:glycine reductase complex component B subunit gamma